MGKLSRKGKLMHPPYALEHASPHQGETPQPTGLDASAQKNVEFI